MKFWKIDWKIEMSVPCRCVLFAYSAFYILTGVWPVVSMRTFEMVTGPKVDDWLVRMVGLLALVVGASLLMAAWLRSGGPVVAVLAVGSSLAFTSIDFYYVGTGRIGPIYLVDAATEIILASALIWALVRERRVSQKTKA